MDSSFGPLDAFAFLVFAILIAVAVIVIVKLGQLPGQLARKWGHPAGVRNQCRRLDRNRNGRSNLAVGIHLGVHDPDSAPGVGTQGQTAATQPR